MAGQTDLGPARVAALDAGDMLGAIASLPQQLSEGYASARERLAGAFFGTFPAIPPAEPDGLAVCGMGGSAIGADLVLACLPALGVPVTVVRGYDLPAWARPGDLVIAAVNHQLGISDIHLLRRGGRCTAGNALKISQSSPSIN